MTEPTTETAPSQVRPHLEFESPRLVVITPCSRPQNLRRVFPGILNARLQARILEIEWLIIADTARVEAGQIISEHWVRELRWITVGHHFEEKSGWGHGQRNRALDRIGNSPALLYFLDDDTILHPGFITGLEEAIDTHPDKTAFVFHQEFWTHWPRLLAKPENMRVDQVDMGQAVIHTSLIGGTRFQVDKYNADGIFIEEIYNRHADKFHFIDRPLSIYNALR